MANKRRYKLCYCYAEVDESFSQELGSHLALLERQGILESFHAGKILPGSLVDEAIAQGIDQADIILLLVSADFLSSSRCYEDQMLRAMGRHEHHQAVVIPVLVRDVDITDAPFAGLQALPASGLPIARCPSRDAAWTEVSKSIRSLTAFSFAGGQEAPGRRQYRTLGLAAALAAIVTALGLFAARKHLPAPPPGMASFLGGTAMMGSTHNPADAVRMVHVRPFALDIDEVTNEQFAIWLSGQEHLSIDASIRFVSRDTLLLVDLTSPSSGLVYTNPGYASRPGAERLPVVQVTHAAAQAYCEQQHKRLPDENEWEFAARGRDLARSYPWGNDEPSCDAMIFDRAISGLCSAMSSGPAVVGSRAVGRRDRTPEGIFDLGGNVAEWAFSTALSGPSRAPTTEVAAPRRIVRGGDWARPAASLRGLSRTEIDASQPQANVGFRCASDLSGG